MRVVGRYLLSGPIASGGMAVVHLGRFLGPEGFSRTVAVKQLHSHYACDPDFVQMFLDEARLAARVRHPNVISPLDIVPLHGELFLVLEYVHGETLQQLARLAGEPPPLRIASAIVSQTLLGLHAAHDAHDEQGRALDIVHRDVSPPNILVGEDGVTRVLDFGIAKATHRLHETRGGKLKGKLGYMSPEHLRLEALDRRSDIFTAGVVLWELATGQALFAGDDPALTIHKILSFEPTPPSAVNPDVPSALDAVVLKALSPRPEGRFDSARDMAIALEAAVPAASAIEVSTWVELVAGDSLRRRANSIADLESVVADQVLRPAALAELGTTRSRKLTPTATPASVIDPAPLSASTPAWTSTPVPAPMPLLEQRTPAQRRSRRAIAALLGMLLALLVGGVAFEAGTHHASIRAVPAAAALTAEVAKGADARREPPRPLASATVPSSPPPEVPVVEPIAAAPAPTTTPASAALRPVVRERKKRPRSCDVPFEIDEAGVKRFRPECFEGAPGSR